MTQTKVAFAGLGNMGLPMAINLIKAGYAVTGCDLLAEKTAMLAKAGGATAKDASQASDGADIIITMLPSGDDVRRAYLSGGGIVDSAANGALLLDCSTIDVATAREVSAAAKAKRNLQMLDAPVSGGVGGAQAGSLTFMVGGEEDAVKRARPLFEVMGKNAIHAGKAGSGQAAKICNNMLLGISMIGAAEAFNLAQKLGLTAQAFYDVASVSSGQCWSVTTYCPAPGPVPSSPANNDYRAGFAASLMLKDLQLARAAATDANAQTPLGAHAADIYEKMNAQGESHRDFSAVIDMLKT